METLSQAISCIDYWIERYQTLITGIAALIGVWYATKPVRQQVGLMLEQAEIQRRTTIVEYHQVLSEAIKILKRKDWPETLPKEQYETEGGEALSFQALERLVKALSDMRTDLESLPLKSGDMAIVRERLDKLDGFYAEYQQYRFSDRFSKLKISHGLSGGRTELWFYSVDMPNRVVENFCNEAIDLLDERRSVLVKELA